MLSRSWHFVDEIADQFLNSDGVDSYDCMDSEGTGTCYAAVDLASDEGY